MTEKDPMCDRCHKNPHTGKDYAASDYHVELLCNECKPKPTISYIIPSINRDTLKRTIDSIEARKGDQILVEYDIPKTGWWGNPQRNKAMQRATGDYLAFIDDDDYYVPGHRQMQEDAIEKYPDLPILFQMQYPDGKILWNEKRIYPGNVSTPMILVPNVRSMLHHWEGKRNMADYIFISKWKWPRTQTVWIDKVLVKLGHNNIGDILHE